MTRTPAALEALRERRRRNRTAGIEPFDAFYQAYVTALLAGMGVLAAGTWLGDDPVAAGRHALASDGASVLGIVSALVLAAGLRSGGRGGPFAIEAPEARHVLLAAVDRGVALRGPAARQLRFLAGAAAATGAVAGVLAPHRLPGEMLGWIATGALYAVVTLVAAIGLAWCAAGARLRPVAASAGAAALVGWGVLAAVRELPSPTMPFGRVGVLPLHTDALAVGLAVLCAAVLLVCGARLLGGASVERLARRSSLVGELRFAATMRDLRTVMVLRRQLTQEVPRSRPWLRLPGARRLPPVIRRDVRAILRMPAPRALRLAGSVATAAVAGVGVWQGTTALVVVAGLASFLAALELLEPLAQELDRPHLLDLAPVHRGHVHAQHLVVPALVLVGCGAAVAAPLAMAAAGPVTSTLAWITAVVAPLAATAGAAGSILRDSTPGSVAIEELAIPPEAVGMRLLFKTLWPPALAAAGFLPLVAAHSAAQGTDPAASASSAGLVVLVGAAAFAWWVRSRDELKDRLADVTAAATPTTQTGA